MHDTNQEKNDDPPYYPAQRIAPLKGLTIGILLMGDGAVNNCLQPHEIGASGKKKQMVSGEFGDWVDLPPIYRCGKSLVALRMAFWSASAPSHRD